MALGEQQRGEYVEGIYATSGISDAKTRILINPSMLESVSRESASMGLKQIELRLLIPPSGQEWWPVPFATQEFKETVVNLNQTLAFEKAQRVL